MKREKRAKNSEKLSIQALGERKKKRCTNNNIFQSNDVNGSKPTEVLDQLFMYLFVVRSVYSVKEYQLGGKEWFWNSILVCDS